MHPALLLLIWLRIRGSVRRFSRSLGTVRGIVFLLLVLVFVAPLLISPFIGGTAIVNPTQVVLWGPAAITVLTIIGILSARTILVFTPAELNLLLPAPFTRRELLGYKLLGVIAAAVWISAFFGYLYARSFPVPLFGLIGLINAMTFTSLAGIAIGLAAMVLAERSRTAVQRVALALLAALLVLAVWYALAEAGWQGPRMTLQVLYDSRPLGWLFAPGMTFTLALVATDWAAALAWNGAGALLNLAMLGVILRLEVNYAEAALETSRIWQDRMLRWQRGTMLRGSGGRRRPRILNVPDPGWLAGAGPNLWRQTVALTRNLRLMAVIALLIFGVPVLLVSAFGVEPDVLGFAVGGSAGILIFVLPGVVRFDYRGDVDNIETLRTLPIRAWPLTVSQLLVPTLVMWSFLAAGFAAALLTGMLPPRFAFAGLALGLPAAAVLLALDNLFFLLYPTRPEAIASGDPMAALREFILFLVRAFSFLASLAVAAVAAVIVGVIPGTGFTLMVAAGWLGLAGTAALLAGATAAAFERFDVSRHTPP